MLQSCEKLHQSVLSVDVAGDIRNAAKQRTTNYTPEQILIDCYVSMIISVGRLWLFFICFFLHFQPIYFKDSQAVVITRWLLSSSLSQCKIFNVAHYSKVLKVSTQHLEYLLIMTRCSCKTRGITLKSIVLKLCPFLT